MPNFQYGIAGLSQGVLSGNDKPTKPKGNKNIFSSRVKDIILDESHPEFKNFGEWASIGAIFIEDVLQPTTTNSISIAYPLFPNIKQYPLLNEVVVVLSLPSTGLESNPTSNRLYYLPPINVWGSQHHNAIPGFSELATSQQKDYVQTTTNYPRSIFKFNNEGKVKHPTQKPLALIENLIKTFSNENETVLDNCLGSGTTAIACIKNNRKYIGFEKDKKYFNICIERINETTTNL